MAITKLGAGGKATVAVTMIDQWLAEHYRTPDDILGKAGLLAQLTRAVVERAVGAERTPTPSAGIRHPPGATAATGRAPRR